MGTQLLQSITMKNPKFQIFKGRDGQYYFRLRAANGEIIASSEGYATKQSAEKGIDAIRQVASDAPIEVVEDQ